MSETWSVVATPQERFFLAQLLCHPDIKWKSTEQMEQLRRFRRAYGLNAPTRAQLASEGVGDAIGPSAKDRKTRNRFTATAEHASMLTRALDQLTSKNGAQIFMFDELAEQILEKGKVLAPDVDTAAPYDPASVTEDWEKPLPPVLAPPQAFGLWFRDVLKQAESFGRARTLWLEGLKTNEERDAEERARLAAADPVPADEAAAGN